jgi:flagellar hook-associated protein 3
MRVSSAMIFDRFTTDMQKNLSDLYKNQEQVTSGKKVNRPSDDPAAMTRILSNNKNISVIDQFKTSINTANVYTNSLGSALSDLNDVLNQVTQLAVQGGDASLNSGDRVYIAQQVAAMLQQTIGIGNTKVGNSYIFAGNNSSTAPINPSTGEFTGNSSSVSIDINMGVSVKINMPAANLLSLQRTNPTDPTQAVLPPYNWDQTGAYSATDDVYEDANPNGGLYTSKPQNFYLDNTNNTLRINGNNYDMFIVNDSNNTLRIDGTDYKITNGTYTGTGLAATVKAAVGAARVDVSYAGGKFTISPGTGPAATTVNFGHPDTTMEQLLGFGSADQTIAAGPTSTSAPTGIYAGSEIAAAITNFGNGTYTINVVAGLPVLGAATGVTAVYDNATGKFTLKGAAIPVNFSGDQSSMTKLLGFNSLDRITNNLGGITSDNSVAHITDADSIVSFDGGVLSINSDINGTVSSISVTVPAGSSLNGIRDAINAATAGVKAEVVNMGTTNAPDYRLVVASSTARQPDSLKITVSTTDPAGTGLNMLNYGSTADTFTVDSTNNQIYVNENGTFATAVITSGTYTADTLATAVKKALEAATASNNRYNIAYDSTNGKFSIEAEPGNTGILDLAWEDSSTTAAGLLGFSTSNHVAINSPTTVGGTIAPGFIPYTIVKGVNDQISISEGSLNANAVIPAGTYATQDDLAAALKNALQSATSSTNTYSVVYDPTTVPPSFRISSMPGNADTLTLKWTDSNTTAAVAFGFNTAADSTFPPTAAISDNALTYGVQNMNLGTDITNYNYITDPSNKNYYSFNNNYLNSGSMLRALNFLQLSLENNDPGRVSKALDYLSNISDRLSQGTTEVGIRQNKIDSEESYQVDLRLNYVTYVSNDQDVDLVKAISNVTQQQTALQALRTISSQTMSLSLFDYLK